MGYLPQLRQMANRFGLKLISIQDLITYLLKPKIFNNLSCCTRIDFCLNQENILLNDLSLRGLLPGWRNLRRSVLTQASRGWPIHLRQNHSGPERTDRRLRQRYSLTPWPGKLGPDDYQLGPNWYGDRLEPALLLSGQQGDRTMSKYRDVFLLD